MKIRTMNLLKLVPFVLALVLVCVACSSASNSTGANQPNTPSNTAAPSTSSNNETKDEPVQESSYPEADLKLIIPFGAGGGTDQVGRMLANIVGETFPKDIIVTNVTGGGGGIGFAELMQAKPDGHTIAVATSNLALNPIVGTSEIDFNEFEHIITVNFDSAALIVRSDSQWNTLEEFVEYAKENQVDVATASPGGNWYMGAEDFIKKSGVKLNLIPAATGGATASVQLLGNHVEAIVGAPNENPQLLTEEFRMLGTMSEVRLEQFPDVPTFIEKGYDVQGIAYRGFIAPKGTPQEIIKLLHDKFKAAMEDQRYKDYMKSTLSNSYYLNSEDSLKLYQRESDRLKVMIEG